MEKGKWGEVGRLRGGEVSICDGILGMVLWRML